MKGPPLRKPHASLACRTLLLLLAASFADPRSTHVIADELIEMSTETQQVAQIERYQPKKRTYRSDQGDTSSTAPTRRTKTRKPRTQAVDLRKLETPSAPTPAPAAAAATTTSPSASASESGSSSYSGGGGYGRSYAQGGDTHPRFKLLFDLLLTLRPGVAPLTFDNYHAFMLVEYSPKENIQFGFEVSPTPRYYELNWQINRKFTLRLGKIWIPFDDMNPHNQFGGWINNSKTRDPAGAAFLPDLWTDLGVALKYKPLDTFYLAAEGQVYVVNGFQSGGVDPLGNGVDYPNFSTTVAPDNNTDKGIGGRGNVLFFRRIGGGASFYTGKYTANGVDGGRITMVGLDGQLRLPSTEFRAGYIGMTISLPQPATSGFTRGGFYGEAMQRFGKNWKGYLRGGLAQNDNRVIDVTDITLVGAMAMYDLGMFQLSFEHYRDLNKVDGKSAYTFSAARFTMLF